MSTGRFRDRIQLTEEQLLHKLSSNNTKSIRIIPASRIHDSIPETRIMIFPNKLESRNRESLIELFNYLIMNPDTNIKIQIPLDFVKKKPPMELRAKHFDGGKNVNANILAADPDHILISSTLLFTSLLEAMKQNHLPFDISMWAQKMHEALTVLDATTGHPDKTYKNYAENLKKLYNLEPNNPSILSALSQLIVTFVHEDKLQIFFGVFGVESKELIQFLDGKKILKDSEAFSLLHEAMRAGRLSAFKQLLAIHHNKIPFEYDPDQNSFLQVCSDPNLLQFAFELTEDINHVNSTGNTALHLAASDVGNTSLDKINFLLRHGANESIKNKAGKQFTELASPSSSLSLYYQFKKAGKVLSLPPRIIEQKGPNCGFYAVACAAGHHRSIMPHLFSNPEIPPRKSDQTPKAQESLRHLRHELGITGKGAVFSSLELSKVINAADCESMIYDIQDYQAFMHTIRTGIDLNYPMIIPFANTEDQSTFKARTAHWATIIGYIDAEDPADQKVLIAQYGRYFSCSASRLFRQFSEIEETYPESYYVKADDSDWNIVDTPISDDQKLILTEKIPETNLSEFKKKLIIVLPPEEKPNSVDNIVPTQIKSP